MVVLISCAKQTLQDLAFGYLHLHRIEFALLLRSATSVRSVSMDEVLTDFWQFLAQSIDILNSLRIRKGQGVRTQSDHITELLMEFQVLKMSLPSCYDQESPKIGKCCEAWCWIFVQPIVKVTANTCCNERNK